MEELEQKIRCLSRFRIEYFLQNPDATKIQYVKDIRERISTLVQEIPIAPGQQARIAYFTGKILNLNPEFDQSAVEALNKALRLDVNNHDVWIELGKAAWKKSDVDQALDCFKTAVEKSEEPRSLCYYATALRNRINKPASSKRDQLIFIRQSIDLSYKATSIDPNYAFAWYSLGNTYLCRFFVTAQLDVKDLDRSINAFERALAQTPPFINTDLHVNYAEALIYKQDYAGALSNLVRAVEIEPYFETAIERLDLLRTFLCRLNECIQRKGKLSAKKLKEMIGSIDTRSDLYPNLIYSKVDDLDVGANQKKYVCVKIVGVVSHSSQIPFTLVGVDENESFIGITVFNFSKHFTALVGDDYTISDPFVISVNDVKINNKLTLTLKLIRVDDPQSMSRNGTKLGLTFKALTSVRFGMK